MLHARRHDGGILLMHDGRRPRCVGVIGHVGSTRHDPVLIVRWELGVVAVRIGIHLAAVVHVVVDMLLGMI
jgi:hypothetical protein